MTIRLSGFCRTSRTLPRDLGMEPGLLCRVCHRRAGRDLDRGARERLCGVWRRAARGAVRQYAHGCAGAAWLWSWSPPLQSRLPRLCPALWFPTAAMCALSSADQRQKPALGLDPGVERFIRYLRESFWVPLSSRLAQEGLVV